MPAGLLPVLGLFGLRQNPFCSLVLRGCVSLEGNSKRAVAGASLRVFLQCLLICRRALFSCTCCSGSALASCLTRLQSSGACCGVWKAACHQSPEVFLYKVILILKFTCLRTTTFACGMDGEVQVHVCACARATELRGSLKEKCLPA